MNDSVRLRHMLDHAREAVAMAGGRKRADLDTDRMRMRNRIVHGYDKVDFDILWDTIQLDLPPLILELEKALGRG
jgi:uncharacterized protein with HEPN domain